MRVLTYPSLFPSSTAMSHGIFIYQRMSHFARPPGNSVAVVAPVPYAAYWIGAKATAFRSIRQRAKLGGFSVYHPRYLLLPKISMILHALLMYSGRRSLLRELSTQNFDLINAIYACPDGAAMFAARMIKVSFVVSARGSDMNLFPHFRTIRPVIRKTRKHAVGTIGVCTPLRDAMVDCDADPNASVTIGNGIDITRFWPVPMVEARRALGIGNGCASVHD
jgi:glycosyl transferase family 4